MALGKPAIGTPNQLDLRPIAAAVSNIRQRIEAIEASLNTTTAVAGTTANGTNSQISALQQALASLTVQVNALAAATVSAVDSANLTLAQRVFHPAAPSMPLAVDDASLTIAQQALQRRSPAPPPPAADSLSILAVQVFGA